MLFNLFYALILFFTFRMGMDQIWKTQIQILEVSWRYAKNIILFSFAISLVCSMQIQRYKKHTIIVQDRYLTSGNFFYLILSEQVVCLISFVHSCAYNFNMLGSGKQRSQRGHIYNVRQCR